MIKGITPSLAEGGKIKIGELGEERVSRGSGKKFRMPVKLDYFLITKTTRDQQGDLELDEELMAALPKDADGQVREIPIVLHSDEIDDVFPTTYAMYSGKKLACRGDGERAVRWKWETTKEGPRRTNDTQEVACTCSFLGAKSGNVCKPHGTLHCSIMVPGQAVAGAVHKWRTTSLISIQRMIGSLQQILATCGTLRGLPLVLRVEPVQVAPDGVTSTVYCCHVELRAKDLLTVQRQALEAAQMRKALTAGRDLDGDYRKLIHAPAADDESEEEQAEVAQEFHPEGEPATPTEPQVGVHSFRRPRGQPPRQAEPPHHEGTGEVVDAELEDSGPPQPSIAPPAVKTAQPAKPAQPAKAPVPARPTLVKPPAKNGADTQGDLGW